MVDTDQAGFHVSGWKSLMDRHSLGVGEDKEEEGMRLWCGNRGRDVLLHRCARTPPALNHQSTCIIRLRPTLTVCWSGIDQRALSSLSAVA